MFEDSADLADMKVHCQKCEVLPKARPRPSAAAPADSPHSKKKVNAFELLGSAMDISNLFEVCSQLCRMLQP